jgi:1-acyl-sn-glycerol-3-phosphate acyltransferase
LFWWTILPAFTRWWMKVCFRFKMLHRERLPLEGPAIYVANHQSYIDPILIGNLTLQRPYTPMARATLWDHWFSGWVMRGFNAIPVDQSKGEAAVFKASLAELAAGRRILIFPEGSRTDDGALHEFKRGMILLLKRGKAPVVPVALEGAYDAWPIHAKRPRAFGRVMAMLGEPIEPDEFLKDGPDLAVERLRREIETMRLEMRAMIRAHSNGRLPASGPGDVPYWNTADTTDDGP